MIFVEEKNYIIHLGSCLDVLDSLPENSVDAIVTDPPYHLQSIVKRFGKEGSAKAQQGTDGSYARLSKGFMGKEWDGGDIAFRPETWQKCLRVLKHGGHILAFNHSRTFHRMAVAIEDAGFEIRDTIMWLYGSGFPKSHNVAIAIDKKFGVMGNRGVGTSFAAKVVNGKTLANGKKVEKHKGLTKESIEWQGWGSALKPSYEPIIMARKPLQGTIAQNVLKWGVGGINIDGCRVGTEEISVHNAPKGTFAGGEQDRGSNTESYREHNGRFPANTIHDGSDEVVELFPESSVTGNRSQESLNNCIENRKERKGNTQCDTGGNITKITEYGGDSGSASRFFYTAKASKKDRNEGLDLDDSIVSDGRKKSIDNAFQRGETLRKNIHPTVKPTDLMQYLIRLVAPKGATILDPFMGSGSTGKAAMIENNERNAGYHFIGIDLEKEYCDIAKARIEFGINYREELAKLEEQEKIVEGQISLFETYESDVDGAE